MRPRPVEGVPLTGPGLFEDARTPGSAAAAYEACLCFRPAQIARNGVESDPSSLPWLPQVLRDASRRYWDDHARDGAVTAVALRETLASVQKAAAALTSGLDALPAWVVDPLWRALNAEATSEDREKRPGLTGMRSELERLSRAQDRLLAVAPKRGAKRKKAVPNLARNLWRIREAITGRPLVRNFQAHAGEFIADDARFVYTVARGVNPDILFAEVRNALKAISKEMTESGNQPASAPDFQTDL